MALKLPVIYIFVCVRFESFSSVLQAVAEGLEFLHGIKRSRFNPGNSNIFYEKSVVMCNINQHHVSYLFHFDKIFVSL